MNCRVEWWISVGGVGPINVEVANRIQEKFELGDVAGVDDFKDRLLDGLIGLMTVVLIGTITVVAVVGVVIIDCGAD